MNNNEQAHRIEGQGPKGANADRQSPKISSCWKFEAEEQCNGEFAVYRFARRAFLRGKDEFV